MKSLYRKYGAAAILLWSVVGAVAAAIVLFAVFRKPREEPSPETEKPVPVRVERIEPRRVAERMTVPGFVTAFVAAELSPEKAGRVVEVNVEKGDRVGTGDVLLRVDDRLWEVARERAEIEAREAAKDYARWQELEKTGAVSESDFDAVKRRHDLAQAGLREASVQVAQCEVRSPFTGLVDDRRVELGEYVQEGVPVFTVVDVDRVKVTLDLPERDVFSVGSGDRIPFTASVLPGQTFTGTVSFVAMTASRESNSFRIELAAANPDGVLRPGMIVEVSLVRRIVADAVVVPLNAVIAVKGEHVVFVEQDGRAERRVVRIDSISGHEAILASGVSLGDRLIVEGHRALQDGQLVGTRRE